MLMIQPTARWWPGDLVMDRLGVAPPRARTLLLGDMPLVHLSVAVPALASLVCLGLTNANLEAVRHSDGRPASRAPFIEMLAAAVCGRCRSSGGGSAGSTLPHLKYLLLGGAVLGDGGQEERQRTVNFLTEVDAPPSAPSSRAPALSLASGNTSDASELCGADRRLAVLEVTFQAPAVVARLRRLFASAVTASTVVVCLASSPIADLAAAFGTKKRAGPAPIRPLPPAASGASSSASAELALESAAAVMAEVAASTPTGGSGGGDGWSDGAGRAAARAASESRDKGGRTPLIAACARGEGERGLWLLRPASCGARASGPRDSRGATSLFRAAEMGHAQLCGALAARGAHPVKEANHRRECPLFVACLKGHAEAVAVLVAALAQSSSDDRDDEDDNGGGGGDLCAPSPMHAGAPAGVTPVSSRAAAAESATAAAAAAGSAGIGRGGPAEEPSRTASPDCPPAAVGFAVDFAAGSSAAARTLNPLAKEWKPSAAAGLGSAAGPRLMSLAMSQKGGAGESPALSTAPARDLDLTTAASDADGFSPVHACVIRRSPNSLRALLGTGAQAASSGRGKILNGGWPRQRFDLNAQNKHGQTALHLAARGGPGPSCFTSTASSGGSSAAGKSLGGGGGGGGEGNDPLAALARLLLEGGASANVRDNAGHTAWDYWKRSPACLAATAAAASEQHSGGVENGVSGSGSAGKCSALEAVLAQFGCAPGKGGGGKSTKGGGSKGSGGKGGGKGGRQKRW